MKTKITYYAEKLAKDQLSAYFVSKHFFNIEQLKKTLRLAEILKEFYDRRELIYDEWDSYEDELRFGDYYEDPEYYDDGYYEDEDEDEVVWPDEEDNTIALPSDRELWILRQARNAAHTFPKGRWPWEVPHIPEEAWKAFFNKHKLSSAEWDIFWAEYYLNAMNIFN